MIIEKPGENRFCKSWLRCYRICSLIKNENFLIFTRADIPWVVRGRSTGKVSRWAPQRRRGALHRPETEPATPAPLSSVVAAVVVVAYPARGSASSATPQRAPEHSRDVPCTCECMCALLLIFHAPPCFHHMGPTKLIAPVCACSTLPVALRYKVKLSWLTTLFFHVVFWITTHCYLLLDRLVALLFVLAWPPKNAAKTFGIPPEMGPAEIPRSHRWATLLPVINRSSSI